MQEALDVQRVQLEAQRAVAALRHGDQTVGQIDALPAGVICPQAVGLAEKIGHAGGDGHRGLDDALVEEIDVRERVDDMRGIDKAGEQPVPVRIDGQMLLFRLVGDMEVEAVGEIAFLEEGRERRQIGLEEEPVFVAARVGFPAENAPFCAVYRGDDLRCMRRAPLREEMAVLKVDVSIALRQADKALEIGKIKRIRAVLHRHDDQLRRHALAAYRCVQRRREAGGEQQIRAARHSQRNVFFQQRPERLGQHGHMMRIGNRVEVQPVGAGEGLRGQAGVHHAHGEGLAGEERVIFLFIERERDGIFARRQLVRALNGHPERAPLADIDVNIALVQRLDGVGIQPRRMAEIVLIVAGIAGHGHADMTDDAERQPRPQRRVDLKARIDEVGVARRALRVGPEGKLEGKQFVFEHFAAIAAGQRAVEERFFERACGNNGRMEHGGISSL